MDFSRRELTASRLQIESQIASFRWNFWNDFSRFTDAILA